MVAFIDDFVQICNPTPLLRFHVMKSQFGRFCQFQLRICVVCCCPAHRAAALLEHQSPSLMKNYLQELFFYLPPCLRHCRKRRSRQVSCRLSAQSLAFF